MNRTSTQGEANMLRVIGLPDFVNRVVDTLEHA